MPFRVLFLVALLLIAAWISLPAKPPATCYPTGNPQVPYICCAEGHCWAAHAPSIHPETEDGSDSTDQTKKP